MPGQPSRDHEDRPRAARADAARNRRSVIDAAREAFARHGVTASLDDVARAAGVGPGTLYRHFPSRDDLILAVIDDGLAAISAIAEPYETGLTCPTRPEGRGCSPAIQSSTSAISRHNRTIPKVGTIVPSSGATLPTTGTGQTLNTSAGFYTGSGSASQNRGAVEPAIGFARTRVSPLSLTAPRDHGSTPDARHPSWLTRSDARSATPRPPRTPSPCPACPARPCSCTSQAGRAVLHGDRRHRVSSWIGVGGRR
jgi:AcrR family transcriptional regulator